MRLGPRFRPAGRARAGAAPGFGHADAGPGRPLAGLNAKRTGSSVHRVRQQGGPQHHLLEGDLHHARQVHEPLGQEGPRRVDRASAAQGGAGVRVDVARRDGEVGAGRGVEVGAPLGQDAPQLGMVALAGALLPGGQRVAVEDPAAALAGLEAASLDGEGVRELAPAVGEEWIGYTKLDSFVRAGRVRRSPWRTQSTPGISPTSSSGR